MSPKIPWLSACVAAAALSLAGLYPVANVDAFGHLAQGRYHATHGLGTTDPFGFAHDGSKPWYNYEWLYDLASWKLYEAGGIDALTLAKLALLGALALLLVRTAYVFGDALAAGIAAGLVVWAVPTTRFRLAARPHVVGMLFAAVYLHGLLAIAREGGATKRAWSWVGALAACHVVWVNLHGSHLLGLGLTGVFALASLRTTALRAPFGALVGLELVASCISPYGPAIATDAVAHLFDPAYRALVPEWRPWTFEQPLWIGVGLYAQIGLALVAAPGLRTRLALPWAAVGALALLALAGVRSVRFVAETVLLSTPLVAIGLSRRLAQVRYAEIGVAAFAFVGALAAGPLARAVQPELGFGLGARTFDQPEASAEWLQRHLPTARVFAAAEDGWYTLFAAPDAKLFMDGRFPFHGVAHSRLVQHAFASPADLVRLLDRHRVDAVLLQHSLVEHRRALDVMSASRDYALVMVEVRHALWVRGAPASARLEALRPGYDPEGVLGPEVDAAALARDVDRLAPYANARGIRKWVKGLQALAPALADHGRAGPLPPSALGILTGETALVALETSAAQAEHVQVAAIYTAMAAVAACRLPKADQWIARANALGETREGRLLALEVALRRGNADLVRREVAQALALPGLSDDPWLTRLRDAAATPVRCP